MKRVLQAAKERQNVVPTEHEPTILLQHGVALYEMDDMYCYTTHGLCNADDKSVHDNNPT